MWKYKTQPYLHSSRHGCSAWSIPGLPGAMHGWFVRISPGAGKRDGPAPHGWDPWRWDCLWVAIFPLPVFRQPPPWSAASGVHVPTLTFASQCQGRAVPAAEVGRLAQGWVGNVTTRWGYTPWQEPPPLLSRGRKIGSVHAGSPEPPSPSVHLVLPYLEGPKYCLFPLLYH